MIMDFYIMNHDMVWINIVDGAESKIWKKSFSQPGEFEIYIEASTENTELLQAGRYVVRNDDDMIGLIERIEIQRDEDGREMMLVSGRCAKAIFARRVIYPQCRFTGTVWNRMSWMLKNHAVNPKDINRQIPKTAVGGVIDGVSGASAETQHTGTNLMTAVCDLVESNNLGWRVRVVNGKFTAELFGGTDRTVGQVVNNPVVFSDDFGNLISAEYSANMANYANVASIAGEGDGADRVWTGVDATGTASGTYTGLERYEMFVDARDLQLKVTGTTGAQVTLTPAQYIEQLQARGLEKLSEAARTYSFTGDVDSDSYVYRTDYDVGDLVSIRTHYGVAATARITAVEEIEDADGYTVTPTFSDFVITNFNP